MVALDAIAREEWRVCERDAALDAGLCSLLRERAPIFWLADSATECATRFIACAAAAGDGDRSAVREWKATGAPRSLL